MQSNETQRLSQIIKESIDNVDITNRFKSPEPCIMRGHELLISNNSSFDQEIKDEIDKQIMDIGMAAYHVETTSRGIHIKSVNPNEMYAVMPAVIGGLKHDIVIVDEIETIKIQRRFEIGPIMCSEKYKNKSYDELSNELISDEYQPKYVDHALEHEKPFPINVVPFYPRSYTSRNTMELVDGILFQEEKQPKENHPYGWYRKFEKKRF